MEVNSSDAVNLTQAIINVVRTRILEADLSEGPPLDLFREAQRQVCSIPVSSFLFLYFKTTTISNYYYTSIQYLHLERILFRCFKYLFLLFKFRIFFEEKQWLSYYQRDVIFLFSRVEKIPNCPEFQFPENPGHKLTRTQVKGSINIV